MNKPKSKTLEYYDFYELMDYVEEKTDVNCSKSYAASIDGNPIKLENLKDWIFESIYVRNDSHHDLSIGDWLESDHLPISIRKGLEFIKEEFCKDSNYLDVYISW